MTTPTEWAGIFAEGLTVGVCTRCGFRCVVPAGESWQVLRDHQATAGCRPVQLSRAAARVDPVTLSRKIERADANETIRAARAQRELDRERERLAAIRLRQEALEREQLTRERFERQVAERALIVAEARAVLEARRWRPEHIAKMLTQPTDRLRELVSP